MWIKRKKSVDTVNVTYFLLINCSCFSTKSTQTVHGTSIYSEIGAFLSVVLIYKNSAQ